MTPIPPGHYVCPYGCPWGVTLLLGASEPPAHACHRKRSRWVFLVLEQPAEPEGVLF